MDPRKTTEKQKPGARPGLENMRETRCGYPAGIEVVGRRAREVMPAAIRALVRIEALARR
jgi:hypothetical protein